MIEHNPRLEAIRSLGDPYLSHQQAEIIDAMYRKPKHVLHVDDIEAELTPRTREYDTTNAASLVKVQVNRARWKLPEGSIQTIRSRGYRLSEGFRSAVDAALEAVS